MVETKQLFRDGHKVGQQTVNLFIRLVRFQLPEHLVILGEDSYNLCPGGQGGWGYVNSSGKNYLHDNRAGSIKALKENQIKLHIWRQNNPESVILAQEKARLGVIKYFKENDGHFLGQKHSEETKQKIGKTNSVKQQGFKNSQYGTTWITNGLINKKIKVVDFIPEGWYKGRVTELGR